MNIVSTTIDFPNVTPFNERNNRCIGYPEDLQVVVLTDIPLTGGFTANDFDFYIKPAMFADNAALLYEPNNNPGSNVYSYSHSAGFSIPYVTQVMTYTGDESGWHGEMFITFSDSGGALQYTLNFYYVYRFDYLNYPFTSVTNNKGHLLKNASDNPTELDNATDSIYRKYKSVRFALWIFDYGAIPPAEWLKYILKFGNTFSSRFYHKGLLDLGIDDVVLPERLLNTPPFVPAFSFYRNFQQVNNLSANNNTVIRHEITTKPTYLVDTAKVYFYLIKVSASNNNVKWYENYDVRATKVTTGGFVGNINHHLSNAAGTFLVGVVVNTTGDTWRAEATLVGTTIDSNSIYRIIAIWTVYDTVISDDISYSFISEELPINPCTELDDTNIPSITGVMYDVNDFFNANWIIASPMIRVGGRLTFNNSAYDATHGIPFENALQSLIIKTYSIDGNLSHYYNDVTITRDAFGNFVDQQGVFVIGSPLQIDYIFRVRYESNLANLYTINNVTNATLSPQSTMDWQGKIVVIEYILKAIQNGFTDTIVFRQLVEVRPFETSMTININDINGQPLQAICNNTGDIIIEVEYADAEDGDAFISFLDRDSFSINNIMEHDDFVPNILEQLTNPAVNAQDDSWIGNSAFSNLNSQGITVGVAHHFCAVDKGVPIDGCNNSSNTTVGTTVVAFDYTLGEQIGEVVVAIQNFDIKYCTTGATPSFEQNQNTNNSNEDCYGILWNTNFIQSEDVVAETSLTPTPGSPFDEFKDCYNWGSGILRLNKSAATPEVLQVYVQGGTESSRSWHRVFCPDYCKPCYEKFTSDKSNIYFLQDEDGIDPINNGLTWVQAEKYCLDVFATGLIEIDYVINSPDTGLFSDEGLLCTPTEIRRFTVDVYYGDGSIVSYASFDNGMAATSSTGSTMSPQTGTLSFTHDGSFDYFVVIVTMLPISIGDNEFTTAIINSAIHPETYWLVQPRCTGVDALAPLPTSPCANVFTYPTPTGFIDSGNETQCFDIPIVQECEDIASTCDELWNQSLCPFDSPYYQLVCANPAQNTCLHKGYALLEFTINETDLPIWGIAPVGVACSDQCRIELPELIGGDYGTWAGQVNLTHAPNVIAFYNGNVITLLIKSDAYCNACNYALCGREWYAFNRYGVCAEYIDNEITMDSPSVCCPGEDACCCPCLNRDMCKDIEDIVSALNYIRLNEDYYPASNDPVVVLAELFALGNLPNEPSHYLNVCYDIQFVTLVPIPEEIDGKGVVLIPKNECNYAFIGASYYNTLSELNCSAYCVNDVIGIPIIDLSQYPTFDYPCVATCAAGWHDEKCSSLPEFDAATCDDDEPCPEVAYDPMGTSCNQNDLIVLQFQFFDKFNDWLNENPTHGWQEFPIQLNWLIKIEVTDSCCDILDVPFTQYATKYWVGYEAPNSYYQQIEIDPQQIPYDCFGFKITLNDTDPCKVQTVFLEPYRKVECEPSVLIQAFYDGGFGCDNEAYEQPDQTYQTYFDYINSIRIPGEFFESGAEITRERANNNKVISTSTKKKYTLKSFRIPPYLADRIINILSAPKILINFKEFEFIGSVDKNNELGRMWILDVDFEQLTCEISNLKCVK